MLKEAKKMIRVTTDVYDSEIMRLLCAGEKDLRASGIVVPGKVAYTVSNDTVTDTSTLTDEYVKDAIILFAASRFDRNPSTSAMLKESYVDMKKQLMGTSGYTKWGGADDAC